MASRRSDGRSIAKHSRVRVRLAAPVPATVWGCPLSGMSLCLCHVAYSYTWYIVLCVYRSQAAATWRGLARANRASDRPPRGEGPRGLLVHLVHRPMCVPVTGCSDHAEYTATSPMCVRVPSCCSRDPTRYRANLPATALCWSSRSTHQRRSPKQYNRSRPQTAAAARASSLRRASSPSGSPPRRAWAAAR